MHTLKTLQTHLTVTLKLTKIKLNEHFMIILTLVLSLFFA